MPWESSRGRKWEKGIFFFLWSTEAMCSCCQVMQTRCEIFDRSLIKNLKFLVFLFFLQNHPAATNILRMDNYECGAQSMLLDWSSLLSTLVFRLSVHNQSKVHDAKKYTKSSNGKRIQNIQLTLIAIYSKRFCQLSKQHSIREEKNITPINYHGGDQNH